MTAVGIMAGLVILAIILLAPAVAILWIKGPPLLLKIAWAGLSLATVLIYVPVLNLVGSNEAPRWWQDAMWSYQPLILLALYALPFSVFLVFRFLVASKYRK